MAEKEYEWTTEQRQKFVTWLKREMHERWMNTSDLAKAGGITSGALSHMMDGTRGLGVNLALGVARGLKISPVIVFEEAGMLPKEQARDELIDQIDALWKSWSPIERAKFLQIALEYDRDLSEQRSRHPRGGVSRPRDSLRVEGKAAQPGLGL